VRMVPASMVGGHCSTMCVSRRSSRRHRPLDSSAGSIVVTRAGSGVPAPLHVRRGTKRRIVHLEPSVVRCTS
jgi:hypothetical protein